MMSMAPALSVVTGAGDARQSADEAMGEAEHVLDQLQQLQQEQQEQQEAADDDCYSVELHKGDFGLGIYFAADAYGRAAVDADVPFYRLPDGQLAPGEASGVISPGDALVRVNDVDTAALALPQVVDELRGVPPGDVRLTFRRRVTRSATSASKQSNQEDEEEALEEDEEEPMKEEEVGATASSAASTPTNAGKSWSMLQRLSFSGQGSRSNQHTPKSADKEALVADRARELEAALERERKCRFLAEKKNILYRNELLRVSQENAALRDQLARATDDLRKLEIFAQRHLHLPI